MNTTCPVCTTSVSEELDKEVIERVFQTCSRKYPMTRDSMTRERGGIDQAGYNRNKNNPTRLSQHLDHLPQETLDSKFASAAGTLPLSMWTSHNQSSSLALPAKCTRLCCGAEATSCGVSTSETGVAGRHARGRYTGSQHGLPTLDYGLPTLTADCRRWLPKVQRRKRSLQEYNNQHWASRTAHMT